MQTQQVWLRWQVAQVKLRETLPQVAVDENFIDLHAFVVNMGGHQANFLADMKAFRENFVDTSHRRIRLAALGPVNMLPLQVPYLKTAAIKHTYATAVVKHGFCKSWQLSTSRI